MLIENIVGLKNLNISSSLYESQQAVLEKISEHINTISKNVEALIEARKKANEISNTRDRAIAYCDDIKIKYFDTIRYHADKLELMVDDNIWPLPKYRELLFIR